MTLLKMTKHYPPVGESLYFDGHEWVDFVSPNRVTHRHCVRRVFQKSSIGTIWAGGTV